MRVSAEHLRQLEEASQIELGYPHDFLAQPRVRERLYSGTFERIDRPTL
jgi:hypothetical protein